MTLRKVSFNECVHHFPASTEMFSFITRSASCSRSRRTSSRNQPSPKTQEVLMKALIFRETGEPKSVVKLAEIPTPPVAAGEALVRVLLSPIHPSDLHMVRGRYGYQPELPASPGIEGVGMVEAVGPGVQGPAVGTRVIFVDTLHT